MTINYIHNHNDRPGIVAASVDLPVAGRTIHLQTEGRGKDEAEANLAHAAQTLLDGLQLLIEEIEEREPTP